MRAATDDDAGPAEAHARSLVHLEHTLGIAREGDLQRLIIDHHWLVTLANWVYIWGHWPLIAVSAAWLFRYRPDAYRLMRTAIFASGAIGMIIFLAYPVAPPRLTGLGLTDTVTSYSHAYRALQPPSLMDRYAALPSLHFGWDLLVGLTLARFHPRTLVRIGGALMPVAMGLAVVVTANHYVIDVIVGGIVAMSGLGIAVLLRRAHERRTPRSSAEAVRRRGDVVGAPLLIAHRAGNEPERLRAAEGAGADVIEADLHLRRGRLELRHLKTLGPLPVYWDRWALAPPWRRFDDLDDLLAAAQPETVLMLDLKGDDPAAARLLSSALARAARSARVYVSARAWPLLHEIDPARARRIGSAARPHQLDAARPARRQATAGRRLAASAPARSRAPARLCGRTRPCSCRGPSTTATRPSARPPSASRG